MWKLKKFLKQNWSILLTIFFSLIALIVAINSCTIANQSLSKSSESNRISQEANNLSNRAIEKADEAFVISNRPYLSIQPKKFKTPDSYQKIEKKNGFISITIQFLLKNNGKVPATNISVPHRLHATIRTKEPLPSDFPVKVDFGPEVTLGPDEDYNLAMEIALGFEEAEIDKVYQEMQADSYSISIGVVLLYTSVLDSSKQYKSTLDCDIKKQVVTIRDKNMI